MTSTTVIQPGSFQKTAFYVAKGYLLPPKRRPFARQKTAFCNPSDYQRVTKTLNAAWKIGFQGVADNLIRHVWKAAVI